MAKRSSDSALPEAKRSKQSMKILLTTTSYQDTPGEHHALLESSGHEIVTARGPLTEKAVLALVKEHNGFDGFLCGDDEYTEQVLATALASDTKLKVVAKYGIGIDKIDVEYCTANKIPVLFTPGVNHTTVAEHTFMLMVAVCKHLWYHTSSVKTGGWKRKTGIELAGKTLGVIGMGRIGREVAIRAKAFGMKVIGFDIYWPEEFAAEHDIDRCESAEEVLKQSNFVTLHCFLDDKTANLINKETLAMMQDGSVIVNTARGGLVVEEDVAEACKSGKLYGYGCDVLIEEPVASPHPFDGLDNVIITPHVGSRTTGSVGRQALRATTNILEFLSGGTDFIQANKF